MLGQSDDIKAALEQLIQQKARKYNIQPSLIKAIIQVESGWNIRAYRWEPHKNEASVGLMQTLLSTARWILDNQTLSEEQLYKPDINLEAGTRYLRYLKDKYGKLEDVIASYNAGSPRFTQSGSYVNQNYVDKVLQHKAIYDQLGGWAKSASDVVQTFTGGPRAEAQGSSMSGLLVVGGLILVVDLFNAMRFSRATKRR